MDIKCPTCRNPAPWRDNPFRPFCSERCRLLDLGKWLDEAYRIPGEPDESQGAPPEDDDASRLH